MRRPARGQPACRREQAHAGPGVAVGVFDMPPNPGERLPRGAAEHAVERRPGPGPVGAARKAAGEFVRVLRIRQDAVIRTEVRGGAAEVGNAGSHVEAVFGAEAYPQFGGSRKVSQSAVLCEAIRMQRVRREPPRDLEVGKETEAGNVVVAGWLARAWQLAVVGQAELPPSEQARIGSHAEASEAARCKVGFDGERGGAKQSCGGRKRRGREVLHRGAPS